MPRPPSCTKTGIGIRKWIWNPVREGGEEERHHRSHAKRHIRGARSQAGLLTRRSRRFRRPSRYRQKQWPIAVLKHSLLTVARPCGNCTRFPFHSQDCREHLALTAANASKPVSPGQLSEGEVPPAAKRPGTCGVVSEQQARPGQRRRWVFIIDSPFNSRSSREFADRVRSCPADPLREGVILEACTGLIAPEPGLVLSTSLRQRRNLLTPISAGCYDFAIGPRVLEFEPRGKRVQFPHGRATVISELAGRAGHCCMKQWEGSRPGVPAVSQETCLGVDEARCARERLGRTCTQVLRTSHPVNSLPSAFHP